MLDLIERFAGQIERLSDERDVRAVIKSIAAGFGANSAVLLEFDGKVAVSRVVDTDMVREENQKRFIGEVGAAPSVELIKSRIREGALVKEHAEKSFGNNPFAQFWAAQGVTDMTSVPVTLGQSRPAGVLVLLNAPDLEVEQRAALQALSYSLFRKLRALTASASSSDITPREKQVMQLAAAGKSSAQIASTLAISFRTVDQYVTSVGRKLGTQTRTQSVAELLKRGVL